MCFFQFSFPQGVCPAVGLLAHMAVLFRVFKGISIPFSIVAVPVCIPTNSVRGFLFSTPSPAFIVCRLWWQPFWLAWDDTSLWFCQIKITNFPFDTIVPENVLCITWILLSLSRLFFFLMKIGSILLNFPCELRKNECYCCWMGCSINVSYCW